MKDIILITPPFTQLNTPYPATAYLKGFLTNKKISSYQIDLGIEVILALFSTKGLEHLFSYKNVTDAYSENAQRIYALSQDYINTIDAVIRFLQGNNPSLAWQICSDDFLPEAARFTNQSDLDWAFGSMGLQDKAKHLATLYLEDISDYIIEVIDANFGFSRYAERIARSANSFDELYDLLQQPETYIDALTLALLKQKIANESPLLIGFSVPFPGNLYSAFRCAQYIKQNHPNVKLFMGGGFPNTELRSLNDKRVFEFFDYITLDDGELPIELLYRNLNSALPFNEIELKRTFGLYNNAVYYNDLSSRADYKQKELSTPEYTDLPLNKYLSVIEMTNPMHSLWSDGRWNKLTMAHGCYWGKCTFCDGSLNYIGHHDPLSAKVLVDRMVELVAQTGENGFHFVDEAAPPALMRALAIEILQRKLVVTWWTNIRFEKSFTPDLCQLLKASGCIAVSGGLEVASDRLLQLIKKGVSVEQVAQVCHALTTSGIMVHAYLMYGFPTQTIQETIDSLEMVRQMFEQGIVQSGFWHQFALTAHSPIGLNPEKFQITPHLKPIGFANNDIQFTDKTGIDHSAFSFGLKKSLYNFMHGIGFEIPLYQWFSDDAMPFKIPKSKVKPNYIAECITLDFELSNKSNGKVIWLGNKPTMQTKTKSKKGRSWQITELCFYSKTSSLTINLDSDKALWLYAMLEQLSIYNNDIKTFEQIKADFEKEFDNFELFWYSKPINKLKRVGLLSL